MNPLDLDITINLPDLWQQQAVREIQDGKDVIVDAPTGAGKTYIFELLVESKKFKGQLVYTVPTRALANDKLLEWREKGWNVGIATGDISENPDAPVLVATLETQKNRLFEKEGPKLLVIDEYQMLADSSRGVNYEITIAIAPLTTQLLLLSGSVGNASSVQKWLTRLGREAILIIHKERPVPQEQIYLEALPDRIPKSIYGYWPKNIAKALKANLEPILIFAPQRKDAERIARQVASMMPDDDPLELNPEQKKLTDDKLKKLLKSRVAYHHSGLSYTQRAGVIEPLAKHGQLRVVVATTGLGSGINFSMRSVIVADRDYRIEESKVQLRPDELLQMFGRAGRRGKDDRGYILVLPQKPRLEDAHPIHLRRSNVLDWSSILRAMHLAVTQGDEPLEAAEKLVNDLFSEIPPELGNLKQADPTQSHATKSPKSAPSAEKSRKDLSIQMLNSKGEWERQKGPVAVPLSETVFYHKKRWKSSTSVAAALQYFDLGTVCILQKSAPRIYGHDWVVAQFPKEGHDPHSLILNKKFRQTLRKLAQQSEQKNPNIPKKWKLENLDSYLKKMIPEITSGGQLHSLFERSNTIVARIDLAGASVFARKDAHGQYLLQPPTREKDVAYHHFNFEKSGESATNRKPNSPLQLWTKLGLIDKDFRPTLRGLVASQFNHGEGLAIAAALEDEGYAIEDLYYDLANLRAGHRFDALGDQGNRLSYVCRETFGSISRTGYLKNGLPEQYGEGASEVVLEGTSNNSSLRKDYAQHEINAGDIERILQEWKSILRQIANSPEFPWDRWIKLQKYIVERLPGIENQRSIFNLPALTSKQRSRKLMPIRFK